MKKVILSSNISHYNHTALALDRLGILHLYISGIQFSKQPLLYKLYPNKVKNYIGFRIDKELNNKVKPIWYLDILYKFCLRVLPSQKNFIIKKHNYLFDKLAMSNINKDLDIFHFVSSIGVESAARAKQNGSLIVIDERSVHPNFLENIITKEYNDLGINKHFSVNNKEVLLKEYNIADHYIVSSEYAKRTFIDQGISKEKISVIPYGYDNTLFFPKDKKDNIYRIIYVGRISIAKGVHYLYKSFKNLPIKDKELILIGKVDKEILELIDLTDHEIKHYSYIPNNELNDYYCNSSVFVLPSLSDSFGLVVLEAMASGLPIIVTENVGAADIVNSEENGFVVPIKDSRAISEKLLNLYENQNQREDMKRKSISAANKYSWDNYKNKIIDLYKNVLNI